MNIVFRADASLKMGSGHIMRCITLAEELKRNGADVSFISRAHEGNLNSLIDKKNIKVVELPKVEVFEKSNNKTKGDNYGEWLGVSQEQDSLETIKCLGNSKPNWIIIDHYGLGQTWEKFIRPHVGNIMVIDDLANRHHECDILLDQNWFEDFDRRYKDLVPINCTLLLGPEYVLLREEFPETRKKYKLQDKDVVRHIFVFFGGSDIYNLTGMTLKALSNSNLSDLHVDVVIGENNPHQSEIKELASARPHTKLHIQVDNISSIMEKADVAIGAGGVNTWERMCIGLPALVISFAENHTLLLSDLMKNRFIYYLGSIKNIDISFISENITNVINNSSSLIAQRKKIYKLVDGLGCQRVVDWLIGDLSNQNWMAKNASLKEMEIYWFWANDKQVRENALNKEFITWDNHVEWFKSKLVDKKCSLYLILVNDNPVGQVRFDNEGNYARIDYSVAKQFRGRRLGKSLLDFAIKEFYKYSKQKILGEVLPDNISSARIFESLGFMKQIKKKNKIYIKNYKSIAE